MMLSFCLVPPDSADTGWRISGAEKPNVSATSCRSASPAEPCNAASTSRFAALFRCGMKAVSAGR
jgi:hypothetical protein